MFDKVQAMLVISLLTVALVACGSDNDTAVQPETVAPAAVMTTANAAPAPSGDNQAPVVVAAAPATANQAAPAAADQTAAVVNRVAATTADAGVSSANAAAPEGVPNPGEQPGQGAPGLMGAITAVDGATITVTDQRQQRATLVTLTAETQLLKQVTIDLAAVSVGETISAFGSQEGESFVAQQVQIGVTTGPGNGGLGMGGPGGMTPPDGRQAPGTEANGDRAADAPGGGPAGMPGDRGARLTGTVTQVAAGIITVQTTDGATVQVTLASDGQITQQVAGTSADLTTGLQVMVMGEQTATGITAQQIQLLTGMMPPQ